MKYQAVLLLVVIGTAVCQYGIPEDDDDILISTPMRSGKSLSLTTFQSVQPLELETPTFSTFKSASRLTVPVSTGARFESLGARTSNADNVKFLMKSDHAANIHTINISSD